MTRKRIKVKKITEESKALKKIREDLGLSQSQLAKRLNISKTSVNHYENGWSAISESYIESFLTKLDYSWHEWELKIKSNDHTTQLRVDCYEILKSLNSEKLIAIRDFLKVFVIRND